MHLAKSLIAGLLGLAFASTALAQKTQLIVYTALETDQLKAYQEAFNKVEPNIDIKWVRDSTGVVTAKLLVNADLPLLPAIVVSMVVGGLLGLVNGVLIAWGRVHPIIITFGTLNIFQWIGRQVFDSSTVNGIPGTFDVFGRGGALKSSWYGDCLPSRDFPMLVDLYRQGRLDLDAFVSERIAIDDIEAAFEKMHHGDVLRSVVVL